MLLELLRRPKEQLSEPQLNHLRLRTRGCVIHERLTIKEVLWIGRRRVAYSADHCLWSNCGLLFGPTVREWLDSQPVVL